MKKKDVKIVPYMIALTAIVSVSVICLLAASIIDYRAVGMFLLFAIFLLALYISRGPILVAAALSAFLWNFLFIPPRYTFHIYTFADLLMVIMYFIIALIGGNFTARLRSREMADRLRERQATALYDLVKDIIHAESAEDIWRTSVRHIGDLFNARIACFPVDEHGTMAQLPLSLSTYMPEAEARLVASQTLLNREPSRRPTKPSAPSMEHYYPLLTTSGAVGVIGLQFDNPPDAQQEGLIQTFTHQTAIALERELLRKDAARTQLLTESERLYNTLLNSVSHELRTPLATIAGASSSLIEMKTPEKQFWRLLVGDIFSAAQQLNRLVKNLLDMSRLESGRLRLNLSWCDAADLVSVVLRRLSSDLSTHRLAVEIQPDLPLVRIDFTLMEQALTNILLNASQYAPAKSTISIQAKADSQHLFFIIEDEGPGFPPYSLDNIFSKFFRLPGSRSGGTGLGLSITRGFIEAHGGTIMAENRNPNGARFTICLPAQEKPGALEEDS